MLRYQRRSVRSYYSGAVLLCMHAMHVSVRVEHAVNPRSDRRTCPSLTWLHLRNSPLCGQVCCAFPGTITRCMLLSHAVSYSMAQLFVLEVTGTGSVDTAEECHACGAHV